MELRKLQKKDAPLMLEWMHDDYAVHFLKGSFFRKTLDDAGVSAEALVIEQGGVVPFNVALELEDVENWSMNYAATVIRNMHDLGTAKLVVGAGRQSLDYDEGKGWDRSLRNLKKLGMLAGEEGIELLICSDGGDNFSNIVRKTDDQVRMLQEIGLPNVKAYADLISCTAAGEDFAGCIKALNDARLLGHVCLADGPDGWFLPGEGSLGVEGVMKAWNELQSSGYDGPVTCRLQNWKYDFEPDEATKQLKEFWDKL